MRRAVWSRASEDAAVNREHVTNHASSPIGGEDHGWIHDVFWLTESPEWDVLTASFGSLGVGLADVFIDRRLDRSRGDSVDADALVSVLDRQLPGQA